MTIRTLMPLAGAALALAACAGLSDAQDRGGIEFEAASVKAAAGGRGVGRGARMTGGPGTTDPGRFSSQMPLLFVVSRAYGVDADQVMGPDWMRTQYYAVEARIPIGATVEQFQAMLQKLLADRFQMTVHRETRTANGYDLVVAKGGPKFKEAAATDQPRGGAQFGPDGVTLTYQKMAMPFLTRELTQRVREANGDGTIVRVTDKTGLTGLYDFELHYTRGGDAGEDIFQALGSQLGLKLEPRKISVDVVVVDKAEKVPREN